MRRLGFWLTVPKRRPPRLRGALRYDVRDGEMARDKGSEELLNDHLSRIPGSTQRAMCGGWAWLPNCGARDDVMAASGPGWN
jgi:hypothetical protein